MRILAVRPAALALALAAATAAGCGPDAETRRHTATLADVLRPSFCAAVMRRIGGAHFHGTARFAAGPDGPTDGVTTTTDVWLDRAGNYKLREYNDRDGGRLVVLHGHELAVTLRYGKMIRRPAEEPEPTRLLEEALGAPWAAWEVVAPTAAIAKVGSRLIGGTKASEYRLSRTTRRAAAPLPATGTRAWRGSVDVTNLEGRVVVDDATGALMQSDISATFTAKQDGRPLQGAIDVHTALGEVAATEPIERPPAEDLALRQRIVPEQRELLGGLPTIRAAPEAGPIAPKGKGKKGKGVTR